jgi:tripartite-type tricarboxylate transporter receptor subunit TctC
MRSRGAQGFPAHPITMVVPVAAGGALDTNRAPVAGGMRAALGQPVVIENVTGARARPAPAGSRARADGYTLIYGANVTHVAQRRVLTSTTTWWADFEPIALIGKTPWCSRQEGFAANNSRNDRSGEAEPGQGVARHRGAGSPSHIAASCSRTCTGTRFNSCRIAAPRR